MGTITTSTTTTHDHDHDHTLIVDRLPAGAWQIDPKGSEVLFQARAFGFLPVTGIFENFSGEMAVDAAGGVSGQLVVQTASINSGWGRRDGRLRSASYFHIDKYPEMTFTLDRFEPSGSDHLNLSGSLQIQQKAVPLNFPVLAIAHGDHLHLEGRGGGRPRRRRARLVEAGLRREPPSRRGGADAHSGAKRPRAALVVRSRGPLAAQRPHAPTPRCRRAPARCERG